MILLNNFQSILYELKDVAGGGPLVCPGHPAHLAPN